MFCLSLLRTAVSESRAFAYAIVELGTTPAIFAHLLRRNSNKGRSRPDQNCPHDFRSPMNSCVGQRMKTDRKDLVSQVGIQRMTRDSGTSDVVSDSFEADI
jgi:hypothetical protein